MLLKYDTYMRIVIPTGNLMSYDWGETGTMENVCSFLLSSFLLFTLSLFIIGLMR